MEVVGWDKGMVWWKKAIGEGMYDVLGMGQRGREGHHSCSASELGIRIGHWNWRGGESCPSEFQASCERDIFTSLLIVVLSVIVKGGSNPRAITRQSVVYSYNGILLSLEVTLIHGHTLTLS